MVGAEGYEVVEVGEAASFPGVEVVDLTPVEVHVTALHRTGGVGGAEGEALLVGGEAERVAHVQADTVGVHDHGDDVGLAGHAPDLGRGELGPIRELTEPPDLELVPEDRHLGHGEDGGAGLVLGDDIGGPGAAGQFAEGISPDLGGGAVVLGPQVRFVAGGLLGFAFGAEHLAHDVADRAVDEGVGLVVEVQDRAAQAVLGAGTSHLAMAALTLVVGHPFLAAFIEVPGPAGHRVPERIRGLRHGPAEDPLDVFEEVVAVGGVGLIGDEAGVVEGDPPGAKGLQDRRQHRQRTGDTQSGAGGVAGDAGLVADPGAGVPEPVEAPDPQVLHGGEQFGFFGVQGGTPGRDVPGPVREGVGVGAKDLVEDLLGVEGSEHLYVTLDGYDDSCNSFPEISREIQQVGGLPELPTPGRSGPPRGTGAGPD